MERRCGRPVRYVTAFDPGLDGIGVAVFDADAFDGQDPSPAMAAIRCWRGSFTIRTASEDPIEARCAEIARDVGAALEEYPTRLAYSEWPAIAGDYGDSPKRRESVNRMFVGTGALFAAIGMALADRPFARLRLIKADTTPKPERQADLERAAELAGIRLPTGPRGGVTTVADERDAMWIGWWAMQHQVWSDLRRSRKLDPV